MSRPGEMNRLYLVRHGENQANLTKEFSYRRVDYSLTPKGVLQAQQTAGFFAGRGIDEIYCSPLKRAYETADIIGRRLGLAPQALENFREENIGRLEDEPPSAATWGLHAEIHQSWLNGNPGRRFPGGENYPELWQRYRAGLEHILEGKSGRNLILVAHGSILNLTLPELFPSQDVSAWLDQPNHNCSIGEALLVFTDGRLHGRLLGWGYCEHLSGEAAHFVSGLPGPGDFDGEPDRS